MGMAMGPAREATALKVVGTPLPRVDAFDKVTGREVYFSDLRLPGMAWAALVRSTVPHGRILRVHTERARQLPGVLAVVTGAELRGIDPFYGPAFKDQPILAVDRVRYVGEPVAAVVAEDEATAREACSLVEVEYEPLPAALTLEEALAPGAPVLHQELRLSGHFRDLRSLKPIPGTNICHHYHFEQGDVEAAFRAAEVVVEDVFEVPAVHHYPMEPYGALAVVEGDRITVWATAQHPFPVRKELSEIFGIPLNRIRVIVPCLGGAYGCKCYTKLEPLAVALALRVRRPVKVMLSVAEAFQTLTRHAARVHVKTAADRDGRLVARQVTIYLDTGAYADVGPRVAKKAGFRAKGPYRIPNLKVDSYAVYTNKVPAGAYRGYGTPQVTWAIESQLDILAERLGMDPVELRLRNLLRRGELFMPDDRPLDADLAADLQELVRRFEQGGRAPGAGLKAQESMAGNGQDGQTRQGGERVLRGRGVAVAFKDGGGTHTISMAMVRLHSDGSATLLQGAIEMGQGCRTALLQMAAEELALDPGRVEVAAPDTDLVPFDQGTSASRSTVLTGLAVVRAAREVRRQLLELAAAQLGVPVQEVRLEDGRAVAGERSLTYAEILQRHFGMAGGELVGVGVYRPGEGRFEDQAPLGGSTTYWEVGMGAAEVAVDPETGQVRVVRYLSAADVGRAIHPQLCEGQDEGGAMQGLGHALFEQLVFEGGQLLNGSLTDYRVPTFEDLPAEFGTVLFENGDGPGPFGSKGVGESGVVPVAPAVANALAAATGVRVRELPLHPERVWRALRGRAAQPVAVGSGPLESPAQA